MNEEEKTVRESQTDVPTPVTKQEPLYIIFGHQFSRNTIRAIAFIAALCVVLPSADVWQIPPDSWGIGGTLGSILTGCLKVALDIPYWLTAIIGSGALAVIIVVVANKLGGYDNKGKTALYVLAAVQFVFALISACVGTDETSGYEATSDDETMLMLVGVVMGIVVIVVAALLTLLIYCGIRLKKSDDGKLTRLGTFLFVYAGMGCVIWLAIAVCDDYSVGAKIASLLNGCLDTVLIYFLTTALVTIDRKKDYLLTIVCCVLIFTALFIFIFAMEPYGYTMSNSKLQELKEMGEDESSDDSNDNKSYSDEAESDTVAYNYSADNNTNDADEDEMPDFSLGTGVYEGNMDGYPMKVTIDHLDADGNCSGTYKNINAGTTMKITGTISDGEVFWEGEVAGSTYRFNLSTGENEAELVGTCTINEKRQKPVELSYDIYSRK